MKSLFLKYNGKRYELPVTADALDLRQYQALVTAFRKADEVGAPITTEEAISALTGLHIDAVRNSDGNATYYIDILAGIAPYLTAWITTKPEKRVSIGGVVYELKDWNLHTLGQRIEFNRVMEKGGNPMERCNELLATVLGPQRYGKNWSDNLDLFASELLNYPAQDLVPIASFFLSNRMTLKPFGIGWLISRLTQGGRKREGKTWQSLGY
jgi:hypothetical protein